MFGGRLGGGLDGGIGDGLDNGPDDGFDCSLHGDLGFGRDDGFGLERNARKKWKSMAIRGSDFTAGFFASGAFFVT